MKFVKEILLTKKNTESDGFISKFYESLKAEIILIFTQIIPENDNRDHSLIWASLVAQRVKCLPAMWETWVRSLGWEDPLKKEMTTHSRILAWKIPWTEKPVGYSRWGRKESDMTEWLHFLLSLSLLNLVYKAINKGKVLIKNIRKEGSEHN